MKNLIFKKMYNSCVLKKCIAFVLSVAIVLPVLIPERCLFAAESDICYGDLNEDKKINILDMIIMKSYVTENNKNDVSLDNADLDGDDNISSSDVVEFIRYFLNQSKTFSFGWDLDEDKLTNAEEYKFGTSITIADTDQDGINDYDELKVYKTNSLSFDTDKDGLSDGEEIKLGLSPLSPKTDGSTEDKNRTFNQIIESNSPYLKNINESKDFQVTVEADISGYIEDSLYIKESGYSNTLKYEAIFGKIIDIKLGDCCILGDEGLKLSFEISDKNIQKYMIFKYYENINMIYPISTYYNETNREIYCVDDEDGTYCIVEKGKWLELITDTSSFRRSSVEPNNKLILLCLDSLFYANNKNTEDVIKKVSKKIFELNVADKYQLSEEFGVFAYSKLFNEAQTVSSYDIYGSNFYSYDEFEYFLELSDISSMTYNFTASNTGSYMITPIKMAYNSSEREEYDDIYVFSLAASKYENRNHYSDAEISELCNMDGLHGSYIISSSSSEDVQKYYQSLADKFNGKVFLYDGDANDLSNLIYQYLDNSINQSDLQVSYMNYSGLFNSSWKDSEDINIPDSDGDELTNAEEINWDVYVEDYTYSDYSSKEFTKSDKTQEGLNQLFDGNIIKTKIFIPFVSNPMEIDTDGDGISDGEELLIGTDPKNFDTDSDMLEDGIECSLLFDPLDSNPDGDSYSDYYEYSNGTDPYIYNLTPSEWSGQFVDGIIKGDIIKEPSVPQLLGQIVSGTVPYAGVVADVRDAITNATYGQWFNSACSVIGFVPIIGDTAKSSSKVVKFISENADKTDELMDLLIEISKKFPDDFAKLVPNSSLDEIAEAFKSNNTISRSTYLEICDIFKKAGRKLWTMSDDFPNAKIVTADKDVWSIPGPVIRGNLIDDLLGNNLGRNYKTYDKYDKVTQIATSIKSIDPMAKTYKDLSRFKSILNRHARTLTKGKLQVEYVINGVSEYFPVGGRCLELAFPDVPLTKGQKDVIDDFIKSSKNTYGIDVVITIITN